MPRYKILIGTSGWNYNDWKEAFYPEKVKSKDYLKFYAKHFPTTEVNYSFYRLPRPKTYQNWRQQTPADFCFAVKTSRFITHIKKLKDIRQPWNTFIKNALNLKKKLGPILFQFPPNFKASEENIKRLENLLKITSRRKKLETAFEFRHVSWLDEKIYSLLRKYNAAWVIADSSTYPKAEIITADFVYVRMHGSKILFSSRYTDKELKTLARKIKKWNRKAKKIYVYFNNDVRGYAVENAKKLAELLSQQTPKIRK